MSAPFLLVAKLGGSLLDWDGLPGALGALLRRYEGHRLVLVVGGGAIADVIRSLDQVHGLGEEVSHELALRGMDLTAHCVASLVPGLVVADAVEALPVLWEGRTVPVFAPRVFLDADDASADDPLPHRWTVTSDSIAARLADRLGADALLLLKSTDPAPGIGRDQAAALGLVDPTFPEVSRTLPRVAVLNLRDPDASEVDLL